MLHSLDGIPWSQLRCQTGFAGHVPDAVLGLMSNNLELAKASYWKLENHVVVQGTLYEAAGYLPPVLLEAFDRAHFKGGVLELLFQIGNGVALDDPELEQRCRSSVISGLKHWLATHPDAELKLREAVEDDLCELQS